jgi:hypothetical protein
MLEIFNSLDYMHKAILVIAFINGIIMWLMGLYNSMQEKELDYIGPSPMFAWIYGTLDFLLVVLVLKGSI